MRPLSVSVSSVNIQKFSLCFSLCLIFSVSMLTCRICSIVMNFAYVLKLWLLRERWRLAGIGSGFYTSFPRLLSLMLNFSYKFFNVLYFPFGAFQQVNDILTLDIWVMIDVKYSVRFVASKRYCMYNSLTAQGSVVG